MYIGARARGFSASNISSFMTIFENIMNKYNYSPDCIYNIDETNITCKGKRQVSHSNVYIYINIAILIYMFICIYLSGRIKNYSVTGRKNDSSYMHECCWALYSPYRA